MTSVLKNAFKMQKRKKHINMLLARRTLCKRIILSFLLLYILYFLSHKKSEVVYKKHVKFRNVVLHLDLKGAPPTLGYLSGVLRYVKNFGVNGVLIEYEDTFPFEGNLKNLSGPYVYDKAELHEFLSQVMNMGIEVIPLVQTFGHMEYVLKHKQYEKLREKTEYPDSICPSREDSIELIREILTQVIKFHMQVKPLKYLHIGCDEVIHINDCHLCKGHVSKGARFIDHVNTVCSIIHELIPDINILIWDDMMRGAHIMGRIDMPIHPVIWEYGIEVSRNVRAVDIHKYQENFDSLWIATAFKGADDRSAIFPKLELRFQNHFSWVKLLQRYTELSYPFNYNFEGIILTGWSRYSSTAPLCELLPAAIPSLAINLMLIDLFKNQTNLDTGIGWRRFYFQYLHERVKKTLDCDFKNIFKTVEPLKCNFYGAEIANRLIKLQTYDDRLLKLKIEVFDRSRSRYDINDDLDKIIYELIVFSARLLKAMSPMYSQRVAKEYIDGHCNRLHSYIDGLKNVNNFAYKNKTRKMLKNKTRKKLKRYL